MPILYKIYSHVDIAPLYLQNLLILSVPKRPLEGTVMERVVTFSCRSISVNFMDGIKWTNLPSSAECAGYAFSSSQALRTSYLLSGKASKKWTIKHNFWQPETHVPIALISADCTMWSTSSLKYSSPALQCKMFISPLKEMHSHTVHHGPGSAEGKWFIFWCIFCMLCPRFNRTAAQNDTFIANSPSLPEHSAACDLCCDAVILCVSLPKSHIIHFQSSPETGWSNMAQCCTLQHVKTWVCQRQTSVARSLI